MSFPFVLRVLCGAGILLLAVAALDFTMRKDWEYVVLGVDANSSNSEVLEWNLRVERVSRGHYAISGEISVNCDVGDEYFIEILLYRSASGSNVYRLQPFQVERQTMPHFMANHYKDLFAASLKNCSNAPQATEDGPPTLTKIVYKFDRCDVSTSLLPSHLEPGYYKVLVVGTGPVEYYVQFLVEVTRKY